MPRRRPLRPPRRAGLPAAAALLLAALALTAPAPAAAAETTPPATAGVAAAAAAAANPVPAENANQGTSAWRIDGRPATDTELQVKGYASATSVDRGETIRFFVTVNPAQPYSVEIYRMGYYQGLGGRLMLSAGPLAGVSQPSCPVDPATGMVECDWSAGYSLAVPTSWTSGVYLAKLENSRNYQSYVLFAVRDDARGSALLYQQSVTTYQAYNNFPADGPTDAPATGKSLYDYNSSAALTGAGTKRAVKVSFDRPYAEGNGAGGYFEYESQFVTWVEQMGYDVSYSTNVDTDRDPAALRDHRGFLSVGHDEYWSKDAYDAAAAARSAGVGLGFFNGNSVYWQIRYEASSAGTARRVMTCYKNAALDPVKDATATVRWRDPQVNRPEQQLMGVMFTGMQPDSEPAAPYVVKNAGHWVYAGTGVAANDSIPGIVGYEADRYVSGVPAPTVAAGSYVLLSSSPYRTTNNTTDYQQASVYQAPSGAWVFAAGTIKWSWGLSNTADRTAADPRIQRITANVLDRLAAGSVPLPAAATNLTATPSASAVSLRWTDNATDATGYVLERSPTATFDVTTEVTLPAGATSYTDTGLAPDVHHYRLRAVSAAGSSPYVTASAATTSYAALVRGRAGLAAYWRLGETAGGTAWDATGSYNGAYTNAPTLGSAGAVARDPDPSVTFAAPARVTLPAQPPVTDFTVAGWSHLTSSTNANYTVYGGNSSVRILARPGGTVSTTGYAGVWLNGSEYALQPQLAESNVDVWVHWVLTRAGGTLTLYRNGRQVGQRADLPAAATANVSGNIGMQIGSAYPMAGRIDEVSVYSRALSPDEVVDDLAAAQNGLAPAPAPPPPAYRDVVLGESGLLAYWRLGEAAGTTAADSKGSYPGGYGTGVTLGSAGAVSGDPDTAVTLNGTTAGRVSLPALPAVTNFTVEGWSYLTNPSSANNAVYGGNRTVSLLARPGTSTTAYAGVWLNGVEYAVQPNLAASNVATWVHWALVRQGGTLRLYRNAYLVAERTDLPATAAASVSGAIGLQNGAYPLTGRVDEVAVYDSALSPAAVTSHYRSALAGAAPA